MKLETSIIESLAYFDIFQHPLKKVELKNMCQESPNEDRFDEILENLVSQRKCYECSGYYSIQENPKLLVKKRLEKEARAQHYFKKLPKYARIIRSFPFVRGIAISGSLSKSVMHQDGDIDYFIISAAGRLWICRTLLILFKKIFLLNSKKYFCVNYFVDENNLKIIDKNLFTAIEINYLAAVYNPKLIAEMKQENNWTKSYLPDFQHPLKLQIQKSKERTKRGFESLFGNSFGDRIDYHLMKLTYSRWAKKFEHFDPSKLELTMRSNRGVSKHHPRDFQTKVLKEYALRLNQLNLKQ